jgi:type II secretory pathway pseudopilin PulG
LCVLAILAVAVVPSFLHELATEARRKEAEALSTIGRGLREFALTTRQLPAPAAAPAAVAQTLGWPVSSVESNAAGQRRVVMYDPALRIGATTLTDLPYSQGLLGASNVVGARAMVISSLGGVLPGVVSNPGTNATAVFASIWEAADETMPTGWSWGGNWAEIKVQRLNLLPLFTQVVLNNNTPQTGRFSIDDTNVHTALPSNPFAAYYFARTALGLHDHNGALQVVQVVPAITSGTDSRAYTLAPSYVYEQGIWRGRLFMGIPPPRRSGQDLQAAYEIFMSGPPNVYKVGGVNQSTLTWSMYLFMSNYVVWANGGFTTSGRSRVQSSQSDMAAQLGTYCNKKARAP